ncbi:MAG TPA: glycosyltransferase family 4 protein [Verrucomicrobiae bacterium]|nr:glycosyltransferase family 4 protein [Verrucomicrobiae bacterium]
MDKTAKAFASRSALAGLWLADKNSSGVPAEKYRRCWPFHLAVKPFYELTPNHWERAFYAFVPIWGRWVRSQPLPDCNVVQAIMGLGTEIFDRAEKVGALKVMDCPNSHPTTSHGYWQRECDIWCPGQKIMVPRKMFARMNQELQRADVVLVASTFCKETMISNGIPEEKIVVNPYGADTSVFRRREALPQAPRFISVGGAITLRKGFQYLFRAFQLVKQALPNAELICVGGYKHDFRRERPKWEGTFTHYERISHPELAKLLQSSTAFVLPSQEEGFARVLAEALAAGLPIVATHESGATTLVTDGVEGFIVQGQSPSRIAAAMIKLGTDRELNQRMGEAAFRRGAVRNTWQDYGDRLLAEYERRMATRS